MHAGPRDAEATTDPNPRGATPADPTPAAGPLTVGGTGRGKTSPAAVLLALAAALDPDAGPPAHGSTP